MAPAIKWTEKYRPASLSQVLGNGKAVEELRAWAQSWESGRPITGAAILYGPAGTGKTSAALALAAEKDWDYIEMNASDARTAGMIQRIAGPASRSTTFSGRPRLVILDEADNLHGTADRGGAAAMLRLVRETGQPVLLIANEYYEIDKALRDAAKGIQFRSLRATTMAQSLRAICQAEEVECDPDALMMIAERAGGDMRSAINDLQAAAEGQSAVKVEDVATAERDVKSSIFKVLEVIFKGSNSAEALAASYDLDESPEDLINWVDENLPLAYGGADLWRGFESLARADIFLGRVRVRQNYGLWRYAGFLMTGGVQAARAERRHGYVAFRPPSLWRRMGQTQESSRRAGLGCEEDRQALPCLRRLRPERADGIFRPAAGGQEEGGLPGGGAGAGGRGDCAALGQQCRHQEGAEHLRGGAEDAGGGGVPGDRDGLAEHGPALTGAYAAGSGCGCRGGAGEGPDCGGKAGKRCFCRSRSRPGRRARAGGKALRRAGRGAGPGQEEGQAKKDGGRGEGGEEERGGSGEEAEVAV